MAAMPTELRDLVTQHRDFYGAYHHHKVQMAYGATTVYLAAAVGLSLQGRSVLGSGSQEVLVWILFAFAALFSFAFINWQLQKRNIAADIVHACHSLMASNVDPAAANDWHTGTCDYHGIPLPRCLAVELACIAKHRGFLEGPRASHAITIAAFAVFTVLALLRLLLR